jgi:hypothetical protein
VGFECIYHYHKKVDGDYDKQNKETFKKKVGDPYDDVPLEKLAASIMAQMARRDIWIVDVEIFELTKKQVSFKESKGGIIIKNKKFSFDGEDHGSYVSVEEIMKPVCETSQLQNNAHNMPVQQLSAAAVHPHNQMKQQAIQRRPIEYMAFVPEALHLHQAKQKNLRFTVNKKYPIFEKRNAPNGGELFVTQDDTGREQIVSDIYFVPASINLLADKELNFSETKEEKDGGNLFWGNASNETGMPDLRRR